MTTGARIVAVIPAAGQSTRMEATKQLLPVEGAPMALTIAGRLLAGGCRAVVIVTRSELLDQFGAAPKGVHWAINDEPSSEMIDSVRIGVQFWHDDSPGLAPLDGLLVCPSDAAGVSADAVHRCLERFSSDRSKIVVGAHAGRRGHPLILPIALTDMVLSRQCDAGLNRLARSRPEEVREVDCGSAGVLENLNTPEDWQGR